jgi:hypothetical protein
VRVDGLAEGLVEMAVLHAGDGFQHLVGDPAATDGGDPHHLAGVVGEPVEPHQE